MKRIAITGGIGCGKSTVAKIIAELGYPVFSCDDIYKEVIVSKEYVQEIAKLFPNAVQNGCVVRGILRELVFNDEKAREKLNNISHPLIMSRLHSLMSETKENLSFAEVPLLFEGGYEKQFDFIILVERNYNERVNAVQVRDGLTSENIEKRIRAQFDYGNLTNQEYLKTLPIFHLKNGGDLEQLKNQTKQMLESIENLHS